MIKGTTKLLGVIGHPIEHSLSPVMHNAALSHLGLDIVYLAFPVKPEDLNVAISGFAAVGLLGFNITIPHKQGILPLLSEVSPVAIAVGAVNTVYRTANGWGGTNTDVQGFLAPLRSLSLNTDIKHDWSQKVAVILGSGGAARAVVAGCAELGCAEIHVVGRNQQKLTEFQQSWVNSPLAINLLTHSWEYLPMLISKADLLVNATPIGMYPHGNESPVDVSAMDKLPEGAIAYDLIYTPNPTLFLKQAQERGAIAIDGLEMLVQQGAAALEIWLKQPIPVDVMRQSLRHHLGL
ncbi:shikimate dehydrogenase [Kamptonema sp. UHCC 0994]|uniref:shikimate dehydrogenase n=1 Tax=Kamptonema sp. UHCC 0994 TaxID=3031329 RepID=UPI0023B89205|nr:shikimate dehydrogenase [Kamptonema sp. UHCC 0994]MDF0551913.1 shikimate dehydrogenase [Kamptonema sp. UHCC 0994]